MIKASSPRKATIDVRSVNRVPKNILEGHRTAMRGDISIQRTKPEEFDTLMQTLKSYNLDVTVTTARDSGEQLLGSILRSKSKNFEHKHQSPR